VAQASIFVIRHGYSLKSEVPHIEHLHRERKLPRLGIVLNGVYSGGRYGYGYSSEKVDGYYDDGEDHSHTLLDKFTELIRRF
jgi:hypothetical protein